MVRVPSRRATSSARLFREHLTGRLPGIIGADRLWSFSYVGDVAEAHVRALEIGEPGAEYMAGGENLPQMRAFELLRVARGTGLPRRVPDPLAQVLAAWEETFAARWRPPRFTRGTVRILLGDWPLDNARTSQELSYRVTPFDEGITSLLAGIA
jgi:nucleoside-diphosphate-sugar epimerase